MTGIFSAAGDYLWNALCSFGCILALFSPFCAMGVILHLIARKLENSFLDVYGPWYIFLTAPGTVIHELGHLFFALCFFRKIKKVVLFQCDTTMGYVEFKKTKLNLHIGISAFFIGIGPILSVSAVIVLLALLLLPVSLPVPLQTPRSLTELLANAGTGAFDMFRSLADAELLASWKTWLWLAVAAAIGTQIALSKNDRVHVLLGGISLLAVLIPVVLVWIHFGSPQNFLMAKLGNVLTAILSCAYFMTGVLMGLSLLHSAVLFLLAITGKHPHWRKKSEEKSAAAE